MTKREEWFDKSKELRGIRGKRVAVVGLGVSNRDLAKLFAEAGAAVTACDRREREELGSLAEELEAAGVTLRLGEGYLDGVRPDVLIRTPGMDFHHPRLTELRRQGTAVTSEMELFFDLCPCPIIGVTGSDGKTTTSTLIAELLKEAGHTVHLGGNIGRALLPMADRIRPEDDAVAELSSFQLISMRRSPETAVITNVTPNHLDVHGDMEEYIGAKRNLYLHQGAFSRTVLNRDNEITASFADGVRGELLWFSLEGPVERGCFLREDGMLCRAARGEVTPVLHASDIRIPGRHNVANYLAAMAAVGEGVSPEIIRMVAREFPGVEHRIEFVRELEGVRWYNDSIATSPARAIAGLCAFDRNVILLAGGYDKRIPFDPLVPHILRRVRLLILMGDTAEAIRAAVESHPDFEEGRPQIFQARDLSEAVEIARKMAVSGDIVSLSPACASFDRYANFEERGLHYKKMVKNML